MFYKKICSPTFEKELREFYKYVVKDLKSFIGWQTIRRAIWVSINDEGPEIQNFESGKDIRRGSMYNCTIFFEVNHEKEEIYLLHFLYRKY